MRMPALLDAELFPEAERCAMRLDGDVYALDAALVPADQPAVPAIRAAVLRKEAATIGVVAAGWSAAWVHGAAPTLARPLTWTVDVASGRRTRAIPSARETVYGGRDLATVGGLTVTTPLRTAFDLAVEAEHDAATAAVCAGLLDGVDRTTIRVDTQLFPRSANRARTVAVLLRLVGSAAA